MNSTTSTKTLTIAGYEKGENHCEHCGRQLLHGIRLADGRIVGAQCFDKVLTLPRSYGGKKYRLGTEIIIRLAKVREFYSAGAAAERFGYYPAHFVFESAE